MEETRTFEAFNVPSFHGITLKIIQLRQVKRQVQNINVRFAYPAQMLKTIEKEISVGMIKSTVVVPSCTLIIYKRLSFRFSWSWVKLLYLLEGCSANKLVRRKHKLKFSTNLLLFYMIVKFWKLLKILKVFSLLIFKGWLGTGQPTVMQKRLTWIYFYEKKDGTIWIYLFYTLADFVDHFGGLGWCLEPSLF